MAEVITLKNWQNVGLPAQSTKCYKCHINERTVNKHGKAGYCKECKQKYDKERADRKKLENSMFI